MIGKKIEQELNKQINAELYSGYMYLSMSAYFESLNLGGFAGWMRQQAKEEQEHAMRFYKHIVERGGAVVLDKIDAPPKSWKSPLEAFQAVYDHEVKVTGMISSLVDLAQEEDDKPAFSMLQWFVDEQVEEEEQTDAIVQKLKMIKDSPQGLLMLDRALGERK